jgi:hypothetical protein
MFILKGKNGIKGRGKWLLLGGIVPPNCSCDTTSIAISKKVKLKLYRRCVE